MVISDFLSTEEIGTGSAKEYSVLAKGKGETDARVLALDYADSLRSKSKKERPSKAAAIVTRNGEVVYGYNGEGFYNDTVQNALDEIGKVNYFNRKCAEVNAISKAINKGYDLNGATIAVVNVRGIESTGGMHGIPEPPCSVCAGLIMYYHMFYIQF